MNEPSESNKPKPPDATFEGSVPALSPTVFQSQVNEVVRVLRGNKLKYTVRVLFRNGLEVEFQSESKPGVEFNSHIRAAVYSNSGYDAKSVFEIPVSEVLVIRCEENEV